MRLFLLLIKIMHALFPGFVSASVICAHVVLHCVLGVAKNFNKYHPVGNSVFALYPYNISNSVILYTFFH